MIAFSAGLAHPIVVRAMKLAKHRGAARMAITDATRSHTSPAGLPPHPRGGQAKLGERTAHHLHVLL